MKFLKIIFTITIFFTIFYRQDVLASSLSTKQIIEIDEDVSFEFINDSYNSIYDLSYEIYFPNTTVEKSMIIDEVDKNGSDKQTFRFEKDSLEKGRYVVYAKGSYFLSNNPYDVRIPVYFLSSHIIDIDPGENVFLIENEKVRINQNSGYVEFNIKNSSDSELNLEISIILPDGLIIGEKDREGGNVTLSPRESKTMHIKLENQWRNVGDSSEVVIQAKENGKNNSIIKIVDFYIQKESYVLREVTIVFIIFTLLYLILRFYFKVSDKLLHVFILGYTISIIFQFLPIKYIFLDTSTTGGDTIFHFIAARVMRQEFLSNFRVTGWHQGNYAGFPLFSFYGPLPFIVSTILSLIMKFNIAFKVTTLIGIVFTPIAVYSICKNLKFDNLACIVSSILSLLFILNESYSMYGGNILSTLAGEFGYSISLTLLIVYSGFIFRGIYDCKYMVLNSLLLFLIGFSHPLPFVIAILIQIFFLLPKFHKWKDIKGNFIYLFKHDLLAFLLIAFWAVPMVTRMQYTTALDEFWPVKFKEIFSNHLLPFFIVGVITSFISLFKKKREIIYILFIIYLSSIFLFISDKIGLVNIRFIPYIIISTLIIAGYGISLLKQVFKSKITDIIVLFLISGAVLFLLHSSVNIAPSWFKWNYTGIENKPFGDMFYKMMEYIKELPGNDRIVYEHSNMQENFGTNRTFESLYYYTEKSTHEGLYIQSSATSPFIYYMQSELSEISTHVIVGNEYSDFDEDFDRMSIHLETFNVRYYIAVSDEVKDRLSNSNKFEKVKEFYPYAIFEYKENENNYVELVSVAGTNGSAKWMDFSYDKFINEPEKIYIDSEELSYDSGNNCSEADIEVTEFSNKKISFRTNAKGCPHLIKISYFPKWKVKGGDRIYKATPNFMLIYPEEEYIEIEYKNLLFDYICIVLSVIGWLILLVPRDVEKNLLSLANKRIKRL